MKGFATIVMYNHTYYQNVSHNKLKKNRIFKHEKWRQKKGFFISEIITIFAPRKLQKRDILILKKWEKVLI